MTKHTTQEPDNHIDETLADILFEYENGQNPHQDEDYRFERTKTKLDQYYAEFYRNKIPEKVDLSTFEPDEDGGVNVRVDENNESITGENLAFLAKYAESKGFNDAIDQFNKAIGASK